MNVPTVWVMGPSSCDKGPVCQKIVEKYGFTLISPNAMVDAEIEAKTQLGQKFSGIRSAGKEVPLADIMPLVEKAVMGTRGGLQGFVIDGYPIDKEQASLLEQRVGPPDLIISLETGMDAAYQKGAKPVLNQYATITMQLDGSQDPNDILKEISPNMEAIVKNRGGRIAIGR